MTTSLSTLDPQVPQLGDSLSESRYILAKLADISVVFPTGMVTEILVVERSQLLPLPFYRSVLLGCIHHAGGVVPLLSTGTLLQVPTSGLPERLTSIYFGTEVKDLAGVGIVVDRILGSKTEGQLPSGLLTSSTSKIFVDQDQKFCLFKPELVDKTIWQPNYWQLQQA